ncbi:hypothetical protein [Amycolatopsis sp. H20-H5]|uniref:hypothetical protein n=1 Tax=Amycolatopsis sp. H20-H5 TaxID=3046309 RepID=UPI002DBBB212|nr:hypothetical protein [Amycolatopsis sp. H20-H5]MEC3975821.1 hypothetical protein [Amycolatopsis sp. H20-H5]
MDELNPEAVSLGEVESEPDHLGTRLGVVNADHHWPLSAIGVRLSRMIGAEHHQRAPDEPGQFRHDCRLRGFHPRSTALTSRSGWA